MSYRMTGQYPYSVFGPRARARGTVYRPPKEPNYGHRTAFGTGPVVTATADGRNDEPSRLTTLGPSPSYGPLRPTPSNGGVLPSEPAPSTGPTPLPPGEQPGGGLAPSPGGGVLTPMPGEPMVPIPPPLPLPELPTKPAEGAQQPAPAPGMKGKIEAWWSKRSGFEKGAMVVGSAAAIGLVVYAIFGRKERMTPNLRPAKRSELSDKTTGQTIKIGKTRYKVGKIIDLPKGGRWGHKVPPKEYRNKGARRKSDYAWPEGYKYPLIFRDRKGRIKPELTRKHVRAAASYFSRHHRDYPKGVQREILKNINRAKKRFGVGDEPLTL